MLTALVFSVLVLAIPATTGQTCDGDIGEAAGYGKVALASSAYSNASVVNIMMNSSRDFSKKMEATMQVVTSYIGGQKYVTHQHIIQDYNKMIQYIADTDRKMCLKLNLTSPMESRCSPSSMQKLVGSLEVDGSMVDFYEEERNGQKVTYSRLRNSSIIVSAVIEQRYANISQMVAIQLGNYTKGIRDPKVFEVPEFCLSEMTVTESKCIPDQWEGIALGKIASSSAKFTGVSDVSMKIASDYTRKMEVVKENVETMVNGKPYMTELEVYRDFNAMTETYVDVNNKTCQKRNLNSTMVKYCENSPLLNYMTTLNIAGSMVDTYEIRREGQKVTMSILRKSFTPVASITEGVFDGTPTMIAVQYGNLTTGISDPSIFKLPSYC